MSNVRVRSITLVQEEVHHDGGPVADPPRRRAAALAVIENPFAGRHEPDVASFMDELKPLGLDLSRRLVHALGGPDAVESYGKGAIVGSNGELEHGALWHVPGGYAMRELLGDARAIVPSAKKIGTLGARLDVPIHHINAAYVRSHFDAMEVGVPDAPRADELVFVLVMTTGGRVHARMGGLAATDIEGEDGLR